MNQLPIHWSISRLDNSTLFEFENGIWTGSKPPLIECAVVRNTNFRSDGNIDFSDVAFIQIERRHLTKKRLQNGDIIIERSGGGPSQPVGRVVIFNNEGQDFCFSNFTTRLRVLNRDKIEPSYLHLFLHYFHLSGQTEALQRRTTGIRNLDFAAYKAVNIPLPPLPEQRAIAATLSAVQDAREARRRELDAERERKAALMEDLFTRGLHGELCQQTEIGPLPMSWAVVPLGKVCNIYTGTTPATNRPDYYEGVVPFVKTAEIVNNRIWKTESYISEQAVKDYKLRLFPSGTVMMAMYGQGKTRGQVALLEISATTTQNTAAIIPNEQLYSAFLWQWLISQYENLRGTGAQGHISHLNLSYVKAYLTPLPPRKEQEEIAAVLTACDEKILALEAELSLQDELFRALLEELMTGRISTLPLLETVARG